jgi:hypothetical protein
MLCGYSLSLIGPFSLAVTLSLSTICRLKGFGATTNATLHAEVMLAILRPPGTGSGAETIGIVATHVGIAAGMMGGGEEGEGEGIVAGTTETAAGTGTGAATSEIVIEIGLVTGIEIGPGTGTGRGAGR